MIADLIVRLDADEEIGRHQARALVEQLVERVLAVGAGLAPDDRRGLELHECALAIDALAVAFHLELLQVRGQPLQMLLVRQHRVRVGAEHARVPDAEQAEHDRQRSVRAAPCGNARPSRARRRASARNDRSRPPARSAGRSTTTANSGRQPSPRTRTCSPARCRTSRTSLSLVEIATKCFATAASSLARARNHSRADRALVIVSCVVKVFDATVNSVVAGCSVRSVSARCAPSTFDTKCVRGPSCVYGVSACATIAGPRSEPPMPMLTTSVMRRPV